MDWIALYWIAFLWLSVLYCAVRTVVEYVAARGASRPDHAVLYATVAILALMQLGVVP